MERVSALYSLAQHKHLRRQYQRDPQLLAPLGAEGPVTSQPLRWFQMSDALAEGP